MNRGAQLLREWLDRRELKQASLAEEVGRITARPVNQSTVSSWLHGSIPRMQSAVALQQYCGIDILEWTRPALERRRVLARTGTEG
jgi:transcriptional regulator with XRE-family HTH domain